MKRSLNPNALREAARVELARRHLLDFTLYTLPGYQAGWVHKEICEKLDRFLADVEARKSPRLMLFVPPRHGKSELASRRFPAFAFGRNPDLSIIATSYGADLASRMNRDVQRVIGSAEYRRVFPGTTLFGKNIRTVADGSYLRNSEIFEIVNRKGVYRSAGVGGGITGMGGDILIVDDPIKDAEQARSQVYRNNLWEWYTSTLTTRCQPGGGILVIQTRWHEDDLAGRLESQQKELGALKWEIIRYPAIAEQDEPNRKMGEALHPDRYPLEALQALRVAVGPRVWSSLYQQRPTAAEGQVFKPDKIGVVDAIPAGTRFVRAWDLGATENDGDFTAGAKLGEMPDGRYIIADMARGQHGPHDVESTLKNTATRDGNSVRIRIPQDPGQAGKAQVASFVKLLAGYAVTAKPVTGDKVTRAEPFAAQVNVGNVLMLRGDWNNALISEMRSFPNGAHDDQVDALSDAFSEFTANDFGLLDFYAQQAAAQAAKEQTQ